MELYETVLNAKPNHSFEIPPNSSDIVATSEANDSSLLNDLVISNNKKNEKLNEMPQVCCDNSPADSEEADDFDDDWLSKLTNGKDNSRVPVDGSSHLGLNHLEIPLLCEEDLDFKEKTMKTFKVGLRKIWKRGSATITAEDPTHKVAYLGNVLTGWAKGEGCTEKPLSTLWKNYNGSSRPDVQMKITVTQSGLKAVTKDHGLIEYWSHRITYCTVPSELPRIFCWIYRHEGRKLKQELRCHAVLCSKESVATQMATTLKLRLSQALIDFKRDKLLRQNARLSLANSVYENPSLPRRKILLSTGSHNYKPPLERSKSAPKLMSIEESLEEEETTPRVKRKCGEDEKKEVERITIPEENRSNKVVEEKCEYKVSNLNFMRKICCSIENLVESTSSYGKKFLAERKLGKDLYLSLKRTDESVNAKKNVEEDRLEELMKRLRPRKSIAYDGSESEGFVTCTEFKRLEEETRLPVEVTVEVRDQESDEGSNSLRSMSSCCSDVSSLVTSSSDKSTDATSKAEEELELCGDYIGDCEEAMQRLHTYLSTCKEALMDEVAIHPTGREDGSDEPEMEANDEDDAGYGHFAEHIIKRISLDCKAKDVPYHKIMKSSTFTQRGVQPSCLQI